MASADLRQELDCPICLSIYTDPVTLRCGHNFCRDCIDCALDAQEAAGAYTCPECRAEYQERPALEKNRKLCNIAEHVRSTPEEGTGVFCTFCVQSPVPAVISCLKCDASLCDTHWKTHNKSAEHVLVDPTTYLEKRKCSVHKKFLEYYCTEDAACICVSCFLIGEHRGHQMESLDEASEKKKEKLRDALQKLATKRAEAEIRVQRLQERRREDQGKAAGVTETVTALFRDIRRQLEELERRVLSEISRQEQRVSLSVSDLIRQLEIKKDELSGKMCHIEELCNMCDPVTVLQEPDTKDLCDTEGLCNMSDPVTVLQEPVTGDLCDTEELWNMSDPVTVLQEPDTGDLCDTEELWKMCDPLIGIRKGSDMGDTGEQGNADGGDTEEGDTAEEGDTEEEDNEEGDTEEEDNEEGDTEEEDNEEGDTEEEDNEEEDNEEGDTEEEDNEEGDTEEEDNEEGDTEEGGTEEKDTEEEEDTEDGDTEAGEIHKIGDLGVGSISGTLDTLNDIILDIYSGIYVQPTDLLLDAATAGNDIQISGDRKTASRSHINQNRPQTPERFQCDQVMSTRGFSSGRHYWEVDVSQSVDWRVGMCYPSIERRGRQSHIGSNNKSWCLGRWLSLYYVIHDSAVIQIPDNIPCDRVRIYLDYEAGQLSFYSLCDPIRHLHTYTAALTEPLHAALWVVDGRVTICGGVRSWETLP